MRKVKKIVSFALCFVMILAMSVTAFADSAETASVMHSKDGTTITLRQHTDVIVRERPSISAAKSHTLYVGDEVYIVKWIYATADDYDWAKIRHDVDGNYIYGYSANYLLS